MKSITKIRIKPFSNRTIVSEERGGYGREFVQSHQTFSPNENVKRRIQKMSILEVIS